MVLTREYMESISFEVAKQKYYNSHKVDAVLDELRPAVIALIEENERLRAQIEENERKASELAEAMQNAQEQLAESSAAKAEAEQAKTDADDYVEKTHAYAEQIISNAQHKAEQIVAAAQHRADVGALSAAQLDAIAEINDQLEELSRSQATEIMRIRRQLMMMATDM